jgi:hypothetical protein
MKKRKTYHIIFNSITRSSLVIILAFLVFLTSCNNCDTGNNPNSGQPELGIYFTSLPLNSSIPTVYRIDPEANDIKLILENAVIYSPPSDNGKIAFIRRSQELNDLMLFDINNNDTSLIESDNDQFSVSYPVISSDGKKIAFFGGDTRLFIYRLDNFSIEKVSNDLYNNSLASFSPNSKMISLFEKINNEEFKVVILDAEQTEIKIAEFNFNGELRQNNLENTLKWKDNDKLIFGYQKEENDKIIIIDIPINSVKEIDFTKDLPGASMPDLSNNEDMVCFISSSGEILARNIDGEPRFSTLTDNNNNVRYTYPDWSPDGKYIIVNRNYNSEFNSENSDIIVLKIVRNGVFAIAEENILISNNSYLAFWKID